MDEAEIGRLLTENMPALRAFVRLRTNRAIRDRESHSDLVQSICREVLGGAERLAYQGEAAFRGWLFTTALRKLVERQRHMRALKRDVGREVRADAGGGSGSDPDILWAAYATVTTPSMVLSAREQMESLERAFDELPDDYREVITLHKIVGLSHEEIARQTGRNEAACRQLLRRALIRLSMVLERADSGG
ncbi:MAG: sigma-70 family RNA polymerase sigma factor [Planctomycetota bacterium]